MVIRKTVFNPIHFAGKLFQQYIIDTHIGNEDLILMFQTKDEMQQMFRRDNYRDLQEYVKKRAADLNSEVG